MLLYQNPMTMKVWRLGYRGVGFRNQLGTKSELLSLGYFNEFRV